MIEFAKLIAEWGAATLEVVGISIIVLLALYALILGMIRLLRNRRVK